MHALRALRIVVLITDETLPANSDVSAASFGGRMKAALPAFSQGQRALIFYVIPGISLAGAAR